MEGDDDNARFCSWPMRMREYRHNPCLMRPISALMLILFCLFSLLVALFHIPGVVLGLLLSPILKRTAWLIEFLYPMGIARWAHFFLVKTSMKAKKLSHEKGHSRTTEQRIEVVKGRVYIHPIPQLLDNIAYLVVCCPPSDASTDTIVGFLVDCGDASAALHQVNAIRELHYADSLAIEIQAVLCTHKHHDHTAGNKDLLEHDENIQSIVGGAVERVPHCNVFVKNRDILDLPTVPGNDMNEVVQVEVIAVPAHTRGSVVYALRPSKSSSTTQAASFLFTGDTMFSGGSGVPFESDIEFNNDKHTSNKKANSPIRASAGNKATERCFMEILYRGLPNGIMDTDNKHATTRMLVFPGHEYTADIIGRQFTFQDAETSRLNRQTPSVYFETASQLYVSFHRRRVAQGKLLCIPSPMSREIAINPHMRTLTRRGEHVIRAVRLWHQHFAKSQAHAEVAEESEARRRWFGSGASVSSNGSRNSTATRPEFKDDKTPANATHWNISVQDVSRPVFATVYADDLEALMEDLTAGRIKGKKAAKRLERMQAKLQEPVVGRRPIPNTLPTEKNMYLAVMGFVMLGSSPCAMTLSDSRTMKLPAPTRAHDEDQILISKRRLLSVLECLGYLSSEDGSEDVRPMIHLLWEEAHEYGYSDRSGKENGDDVEAGDDDGTDQIELGVLRWMLYGIEAQQPSWFGKFCMPCGTTQAPAKKRDHPIHSIKLRRTGGEFVRHDPLTCLLCRSAAGCPEADKIGGSDTTIVETRTTESHEGITVEPAPQAQNGLSSLSYRPGAEIADDASAISGTDSVHLPVMLGMKEKK